MNNDLISREALKKYARVVFDKDLGRLRVVDVSDIDNAPTVTKIDTNDIEYKAYCKGLEDGKKIARPQGEWIYKEFDVETGISHSYWCSNCGEPKSQWCDDFCQRCGADMRGIDNG